MPAHVYASWRRLQLLFPQHFECVCVAGKAAKFLGKLGQKLARNVYNEAGEALQGHMRTATDLRAPLPSPSHLCSTS